jgi:hypothetical protein
VVVLVGFLCRDNPENVARFLRLHNFIVASFYEEHFDLTEVVGLRELMNLPLAKLRDMLDACSGLLLALADRGQADDSHAKYLKFLKYTLLLNEIFGVSLHTFGGMLRNSRRLQNFKLASKYEELTVED